MKKVYTAEDIFKKRMMFYALLFFAGIALIVYGLVSTGTISSLFGIPSKIPLILLGLLLLPTAILSAIIGYIKYKRAGKDKIILDERRLELGYRMNDKLFQLLLGFILLGFLISLSGFEVDLLIYSGFVLFVVFILARPLLKMYYTVKYK